MRINFHKIDLMTINMNPSASREFALIFCCKLGSFPFKYLGVPLHYSKLRKEDLQPIVDKVIKRISGWKGRFLSYGGKLVLLKSCISSIPTYLLSFLKFPKWAIHAISSQMSHFFWGNYDDQHKYHLANWGLISPNKNLVGWVCMTLGISTFVFWLLGLRDII